MESYKLYKIDCLLGQKRTDCEGLTGLARGKGIIGDHCQKSARRSSH